MLLIHSMYIRDKTLSSYHSFGFGEEIKILVNQIHTLSGALGYKHSRVFISGECFETPTRLQLIKFSY